MKKYDPGKPLISLHVPKCAGQSFRRVLKKWFGDNLKFHYFQENNAPPIKHELSPHICIHGHFNREKKWGVDHYYPRVDQFITVLREPLDAAVSNYFFWKKKGRARQLARGDYQAGSIQDYRGIDDFFRQRPRSHFLHFLPCEMTAANYKDIFETKFIWIGLVEQLQTSVDELARILGYEPEKIDRINASEHDEELSPQLAQKFIEENSLVFEMYHYLKKTLRYFPG